MKVKMGIAILIAAALLPAFSVRAGHGNHHGNGTDDGSVTNAFDNSNDNSGGNSNRGGHRSRRIDDQTFVTQAAQAGLFEVQLGQLAVDNSSNADVVAYGEQLINDHSAANDQLIQIATDNGLEVPTDVGKSYQKQLDRLSGLSGAQFDRAFTRIAISSHVRSLRLFQAEADSGQIPDLQAFAEANLPVLQEHLDEARGLAETVSASGNRSHGHGHGHNNNNNNGDVVIPVNQ
jgi:putative membrane protein